MLATIVAVRKLARHLNRTSEPNSGGNMKITTIALAALLVLCTADRTANTAKPASEKKVGARTEVAPAASPDSEAITLVPFEERLVVQAGHQIVVLAGSPCKPGETAGSIELLPPTPDFVELIPLCRSDRGLTGALVLHPANKDLGLHTVKLRTVGCDGSGTEYLFDVKVKRP